MAELVVCLLLTHLLPFTVRPCIAPAQQNWVVCLLLTLPPLAPMNAAAGCPKTVVTSDTPLPTKASKTTPVNNTWNGATSVNCLMLPPADATPRKTKHAQAAAAVLLQMGVHARNRAHPPQKIFGNSGHNTDLPV
jgi:hypothetical protein